MISKSIKDRPCTRRGILSMVNSVHDPLGIAAPFILPGMLFHQDLDPKCLEGDDEIFRESLNILTDMEVFASSDLP